MVLRVYNILEIKSSSFLFHFPFKILAESVVKNE